jgi:phosphatidate cytidylyltransferase
MSYLDPRAGHSSGDDTGVPAQYAYADFQPQPPAEQSQAWHADENELTQSGANEQNDDQPKRGPGKRRATGRTKSVSSRAGRNLPAAIAVGLSLVLLVLASLVIWPPAFLGVIVVAGCAGVWEMVRALRASGADAPLVPLLGGAVLMTGLVRYGGEDSLILGLVATVLAAMIWRISDGAAAFRRDITASVLTAIYVPFLISFAILLQEPDPSDTGRWRVLCTLFAVVLSDTGGYATGVFFGKHKMAPSISPGKTWEGFAGSIAAAALGSALFLYFLLDIPAYWGLLFGAVISVVAVVGDLGESMLKRDLGIKDMSNLLPGHGGVMDRLDSILFAVPTAYLLFAVISANVPS